jgi:hypothetical protein
MCDCIIKKISEKEIMKIEERLCKTHWHNSVMVI